MKSRTTPSIIEDKHAPLGVKSSMTNASAVLTMLRWLQRNERAGGDKIIVGLRARVQLGSVAVAVTA
jgi:hypothetical protein